MTVCAEQYSLYAPLGGEPLASWPLLIFHTSTVTGWIAAICLGLRYASAPLLRLVSGLVVILARDKDSRVDRAFKVLQAIPKTRDAKLGQRRRKSDDQA